MTKFKIKFRGVRGSYPAAKSNFLKYGGNTSCVEVRCGKQLIILDSGTGIIDIGNDVANNDFRDINSTIILSHIHQDHIQGLQFYKPLFNKDSKINLFGLSKSDEDLKTTLKNILFDTVFPLSLHEIKSDFQIHNLIESDILLIFFFFLIKKLDKNINDIKVNENVVKISSYKTPHPKHGCLCVKIEYNNKTLVYATDRESIEDGEFINFAKNSNCLIHDAQYTNEDYNDLFMAKKGFGHSTYDMAINVFNKTNSKKLFFYHYDPDYDDNILFNLEKKYATNNIIFAKENFEFEL